MSDVDQLNTWLKHADIHVPTLQNLHRAVIWNYSISPDRYPDWESGFVPTYHHTYPNPGHYVVGILDSLISIDSYWKIPAIDMQLFIPTDIVHAPPTFPPGHRALAVAPYWVDTVHIWWSQHADLLNLPPGVRL